MLRPCNAYVRQLTEQLWVQIIACCLFGGKKFYEPVAAYCQLGPWKLSKNVWSHETALRTSTAKWGPFFLSAPNMFILYYVWSHIQCVDIILQTFRYTLSHPTIKGSRESYLHFVAHHNSTIANRLNGFNCCFASSWSSVTVGVGMGMGVIWTKPGFIFWVLFCASIIFFNE